MTQEEKQLLLKDLCARVPYGVICFAPDYEYGVIGKLWCIEPFEDLNPPITIQYPKGNTVPKFCSVVIPYLRPMSSMTEEEKSTYLKLRAHALPFSIVEWLDKNHFDHRTNNEGEHLIEIELALEAPEGMYKTESL